MSTDSSLKLSSTKASQESFSTSSRSAGSSAFSHSVFLPDSSSCAAVVLPNPQGALKNITR